MGFQAQGREVNGVNGTMMRKLRGRAGASLTFALLLFLVCAVIGSVVLAAGTAAAGRFSQLTSMDARYYAVTSAARLFCDQLDGRSVTVTRVRVSTETETTTYTEQPDSTVTETVTTSGPDYTYSSTLPAAGTLLGDAATTLVFGSVTDYDSAEGWNASGASAAATRDLTVTVGDKTSLTVNVRVSQRPDGVMELTFSNADEPKYTVLMTLACSRSGTPGSTTAYTTSSGGSGLTRTETVTAVTRETRPDTFTWTVTSMKKVSQ